MNLNEFGLENFKNIQEIIKFTDQKAGFLLVVYGFVLTAFIEASKDLVFCNPVNCASRIEAVQSIFTFIVGFILIIAIAYQFYILIFRILKPRSANHYKNNELSLFYFGHICKMEPVEFSDKFDNLNDESIKVEIKKQIYEVSKIAAMKTKSFNHCLFFIMPTVFLIVAFCLLSL